MHTLFLENFFFVYCGVSFKSASRSSTSSNSFTRDNVNVPLLIAAFKTFVTLLIAVFGDFSSIFAAIRKSFHVHAGYPNI